MSVITVDEALAKWIEEHNAFDMPPDEVACRYILEIAENTTYSDEKFKERLIKSIKEYAHTIGVDLNG